MTEWRKSPVFVGFIKIHESKLHASSDLPEGIAVVTFFSCQLSEKKIMKNSRQQACLSSPMRRAEACLTKSFPRVSKKHLRNAC